MIQKTRLDGPDRLICRRTIKHYLFFDSQSFSAFPQVQSLCVESAGQVEGLNWSIPVHTGELNCVDSWRGLPLFLTTWRLILPLCWYTVTSTEAESTQMRWSLIGSSDQKDYDLFWIWKFSIRYHFLLSLVFWHLWLLVVSNLADRLF